MFDTEHVWTFQIYDQVMDYSTFKLPLPFFPIEVAQVRLLEGWKAGKLVIVGSQIFYTESCCAQHCQYCVYMGGP